MIVGLWLLGKNNVVKRQFTDLIFIMIIGLNFSLWYTSEKDKKIKSKKKVEDKKMEKTLTIEGMMCGHCEARVKKALEALPEVKEAVVSHEAGTAVVTLESVVSDEALKEAVEAQDYKVISVQ